MRLVLFNAFLRLIPSWYKSLVLHSGCCRNCSPNKEVKKMWIYELKTQLTAIDSGTVYLSNPYCKIRIASLWLCTPSAEGRLHFCRLLWPELSIVSLAFKKGRWRDSLASIGITYTILTAFIFRSQVYSLLPLCQPHDQNIWKALGTRIRLQGTQVTFYTDTL